MKITIKGNPKEIAAFVLSVQERQQTLNKPESGLNINQKMAIKREMLRINPELSKH